jgi:hypothetical protein
MSNWREYRSCIMCGAWNEWYTVSRCSAAFQSASWLRGSSVTPVWRPNSNVVSTTASARAKASSTPPVSSVRVKHRLSPSSGWMTGVDGSSADSMSTTGGSRSKSTCSTCNASSACSRVSATMATTGSPCQQARSMASGYCGADFMPARWARVATQGLHTVAMSRPSATRMTPGMARAAAASMDRMRQCATGLRQYTTCASRGSSMSSRNWPRPSTSRRALGREALVPM